MTCKRIPASFSAGHAGLYAKPPEAVIAMHRDGSVAGTGKRFEPRQRRGLAESIAVQMRDAKGAGAEAKRQFSAAFAPCPGEPKCATGIERFEVPRVPGAVAVEIRHKVDGNVFDNTTIVFSKGAFVYQVFASGAGIGRPTRRADRRRPGVIRACAGRSPAQLTAPKVRQGRTAHIATSAH
jgi:hypothetical protein